MGLCDCSRGETVATRPTWISLVLTLADEDRQPHACRCSFVRREEEEELEDAKYAKFSKSTDRLGILEPTPLPPLLHPFPLSFFLSHL